MQFKVFHKGVDLWFLHAGHTDDVRPIFSGSELPFFDKRLIGFGNINGQCRWVSPYQGFDAPERCFRISGDIQAILGPLL